MMAMMAMMAMTTMMTMMAMMTMIPEDKSQMYQECIELVGLEILQVVGLNEWMNATERE